LEADLQAVLVFFESRDEGWRLLRSRWNTTLAGHLDRLVFLPEQSYEDFHRVLLLADALLDTRHFGVGFVAFDALAMDLPIVTLPGEFNMSRAVQAMYRLMNIEGLVASSVEEYVRMAVSLGTDDDYRETMRRLISERKEVLFESEEVVREHERFFETAIEAARHPSRAAAG
jgi:protein O-GlcNAc transferase